MTLMFWYTLIVKVVRSPLSKLRYTLSPKGSFTRTPQCASNTHPIRFQRSHETELESDAHRMRIAFNPPREVVWKQIETGLHYYS